MSSCAQSCCADHAAYFYSSQVRLAAFAYAAFGRSTQDTDPLTDGDGSAQRN